MVQADLMQKWHSLDAAVKQQIERLLLSSLATQVSLLSLFEFPFS